MGIRETLNRHRAITMGVTIGIIVVAVIAIIWHGSGRNRSGDAPAQGYFTTDDGATWFADSLENLPPYTKEGKEAVRAYLFKCGDGKPFVASLERYTPEARKVLEQTRARMKANPQNPAAMAMEVASTMRSGTEVKKPLDPGGWHLQMPGAGYLLQMKCPDGTTGSPEPVVPSP